MKKLFLPVLCLILFGFTSDIVKLTEEERNFAVSELTKAKDQLLNTLDGLSEEQLNFKPDASSWSIAEGVEHLTISENAFHDMLTASLENPADPARRSEVKMQDGQLMDMIRDRTQKVKTSEPFEPSGKFGSYEETLDALLAKRSEHIEYLKTTEDDLRNHYGQLPFGTIDAYQMILFMSGHMDRHVAQMDEVINHEDFPE
ncbi:DinB family protein [Muriicola soli]|uniref:DinB family protein n=1 Tax=Muriicola soli TaxID=2507538 RepID=A0A411E847_9FLAO|nr:DinB family protein [Muriicola soli]QBA63694.1 DinB family protein [Muriicola soli]